MSDTILAIDLGGTRFRAALASADDPVVLRMLAEETAPQSRDVFLTRLRQLLGETGATRLGLGIPGLAQASTCRWVPNLPYLDGLDLAEALPGTIIGLGHDAQLALLAESTAGAAVGLSDAILLAIGTGIGSAVLAGGRIVAGSGGAACSFGWAAADVNDLGEDRSGWLERHASGRALDAVATTIGAASGAALVQAARSGSALAIETLAKPMTSLGTALAGAVALLDPAAIIFAGGVAESLDVLGPLILPALRRQLPAHLRGIELRAGRFGAQAGLVGAALAGARGPNWRNAHG
ncbi:MAG: ROK family protein [Devosia nanyangense]|uniref:ROK family protein n=1 Tax=Devosia nanyangense TaxID=1228055 RepID=A0A933L731_9HYPH|nr:ROK family protein [Devosia nanyangense]